MASILLEAISHRPGASKLTLLDGTDATGFKLMPGVDWGNAVWEQFFSGQRSTLGARLASAQPQNRPVLLPLAIREATTDAMHARLSELWAQDDDWRRFGGSLTWRPEGGTYRQYFDVLSSSARIANYDWYFHNKHYVVAELGLVCAPYLRYDSFDIFDDFATDTSADWTIDAGTGFGISGGQLVPTSTGVKRWRHTGKGHSYGDVEVTLKLTTGGSVVGYTADVFCAGDTGGAESFISAQVTSSALRLLQWTAGSAVEKATTAFSPSTNTTYWLRIRRTGSRVAAYIYATQPSPAATPSAVVGYSLTMGENQQRGPGHTGFRINVVNTSERYDDFEVHPNTYGDQSADAVRALIAPDEAQLRPALVGDAPGLADVSITTSGGSVPIWGMFGWWRRPSVWNYVYNGDYEDDVDGWTTAGVSGVTGACTSFTRSTTAARNKYGGANGQIVCPATANTGVAFRMERRFYRGQLYLAFLWASSASGTTANRIRLGVSGDISSETSGAVLSPTPTLHRVLWTPTADRDGAYVAAEITAATATTWNIDGVVVIEARATPLTNSIDADDTTCVVDRIPDDWPPTPFLAYSSGAASPYEFIRVEAIDQATRTLTIVRGQEGTTGASAAAGNLIIPVPELRYQYEGKGAQPPVGVIEGESDDSGNRFTWAYTAVGTARMGNMLKVTGSSGSGLAAANYLIDPHLLHPDDLAQDEVAIEVWGRLWIHAGLNDPRIYVGIAPETATVSSGLMTSNYGTPRYAEEYEYFVSGQQRGKPLVKPSSGGAFRFCFLGTIRMPVDRTRPQRYRLHVLYTWTGATSGESGLDYLVLVPANSRCLSPTARANDVNFPKFIPSTSETTKTVRSDGSGLIAKPPGSAGPDHGLGGSLIELPYGPVDCLLKTSTLVPDDPTSDTSSETDPTASAIVHIAVTPRGVLARSS